MGSMFSPKQIKPEPLPDAPKDTGVLDKPKKLVKTDKRADSKANKKRSGTSRFRIDLGSTSGGSGLNIPT
tara:strand:- start:9761 stop:9970 length:210 start_codon:yes stop_codon:yes gene_type:complete